MPLFSFYNDAYHEPTEMEIMHAAMEICRKRVAVGEMLTRPSDTADWLNLTIGMLEHESFVVIYLDNRNRVITHEELFRGTIDGATVHPREVVKAALKHNAAAVILAHNHPSGVCEPSTADELITRRLKESLACVDIRILDHVVVAGGHHASMAERGML